MTHQTGQFLTPPQRSELARVLRARKTDGLKVRRANDGLASIDLKGYSRRDGHLTPIQELELTALFRTHPPRTTDEVRAVIADKFDVSYSKSGAIKLMDRLGFGYRKPKSLPAGADEAKQMFWLNLPLGGPHNAELAIFGISICGIPIAALIFASIGE